VAPSAQQIKLTAKDVMANNCIGNKKAQSLLVNLRLRLVNDSNVPIMVFMPLSGVTIISHTLRDANAGKHEIETHPPDSSIRAPQSGIQSRSQQRVVGPGESLEFTTDPVQLFVRDGPTPDSVSLRPGTHYIQFQIDVFPPDAKVADLISVVQRVMSDPAPVNIKEDRTAPRCSELFRSK
jgi:hypothetical protein